MCIPSEKTKNDVQTTHIGIWEDKRTSCSEQGGPFANTITEALNRSNWLQPAKHDIDYDCIYQLFRGIYKGVGILVVENLTQTVSNMVSLRGIVIKDIKDLRRDNNLSDAMEYVDYLYVAIPNDPEIIKAADMVRQPEWGVMTVNRSGDVHIVTQAQRLHPSRREESLSRAIIETVIGAGRFN